MPADSDIMAQQELLKTNRKTLAHLLIQAAAYGGEAFAPPATANGMSLARAGIAHSKATLGLWGVAYEDLPDDVAPIVSAAALKPASALTFNISGSISGVAVNMGGYQHIDQLTSSHTESSGAELSSLLAQFTQLLSREEHIHTSLRRDLSQLLDLLRITPESQQVGAITLVRRVLALVDAQSTRQPDSEYIQYVAEGVRRAATPFIDQTPIMAIIGRISASDE